MKLPTLDQLGIPGVAGLGLLLFGFSFYFGSVAQDQAELTNLKQEESQLQAAAPSRMPEEVTSDGAGRPPGVQRRLSMSEFPEVLGALNALAELHGVAIERASYLLIDRDGQRRMEINLPLKSTYPALRAYLRAVMLMNGAPALDELTLKRQQSSDPVVEATIRLSYPFFSVP
jgi:hypothetical protein